MIEKIVRGLFFYKSQVVIPNTHCVKVFPGNGFWDDAGFQNVLQAMDSFMGLGDDVFALRCHRDEDDPAATVWLLVFYRNVAVFAWTERKENGDGKAV